MQWKRHLLTSGAVLAATLATTAHAQTRSGTTAAASNTIEELVVTAEKRQQSLQDVPVAVSAFTSEKRDLVGINTITDMTNFTPGLEYNAQNDRNTLRGVGRNTNVHAAEGSVAIYSDGIYTSSTVEAGKTPLFVDRVEVLRGPQGTLYGRNAIGGAINVISKRPTEDWYAEVRGQYQNYDHFITEAAVSGPTPIPGVQFRLAANWEKQTEGWFKNTVPGQPDEGNIIDTKLVEGQLKMKFNDRFDAWMKLSWIDWHNDGGGPGSRSTWTPSPFPNFEAVNGGIAPTSGYACLSGTLVSNVITPPGMTLAQACHNSAVDDPRKITSDVPYQVKLTGTMIFSSEWNYHFDNWDLKYIAGGTHYNYALTGPTPVDQAPILSFQLPFFSAAGVSPGAVVHPRYAFTYHEALNWISHEINIASTDKGPLQWLAGLYYYDEHYVQPVSTQLMDQGAPVANGPLFLPGTFCAATSGCAPLGGESRIYDDRPELTTQSKAAFVQLDWNFAEHWKTTLGLRYTKDHKFGSESLRLLCFDVAACTGGFGPEVIGNNIVDLSQPQIGVLSYASGGHFPEGVSSPTTLDPATGFATRHYNEKWSATTGTFGLQWDPEPGTMAYFRYSRGYKAGAFRIGIDTIIGAFPAAKPEHADAFEIGLKKDFGRTLQTNIAIFRYNYDNDQVPLSVVQTAGGPGPATSVFFNVPRAISQGFELESTWQPIDHLQILFNYSYLDAHVTKGDGVVDPADPAALAPGAKPTISFAQCLAAVGTASACSTDVFTGATAFAELANGTFVPISSVIGAGNGGFQRPQSIVGSHLPQAPKNKVAVNVNYTYELNSGSLIGSVSYIWRDKQFGSVFDRSYYQAPSWDQWDARLTYKDRNNRYTVIAFIKNIFNDLGYEGGASPGTRSAGFVPAYVVGKTGVAATPVVGPNNGIRTGYLLTPPRTYGIELQYRFF